MSFKIFNYSYNYFEGMLFKNNMKSTFLTEKDLRKGEIVMIEDYWIDMCAFHVIFLTIDNRKIEKLLFFTPQQLKHEEVNEIVKEKFHNVDKVLLIEEVDDGLALR